MDEEFDFSDIVTDKPAKKAPSPPGEFDFSDIVEPVVEKKSQVLSPPLATSGADLPNPYRLPGELSPIAGSETPVPLKAQDGAIAGYGVDKPQPLGIDTMPKPTLSASPIDRDRIIENGRVDKNVQAKLANEAATKDSGQGGVSNFLGAVNQSLYALPADLLDAIGAGVAATSRGISQVSGSTPVQSKDTWEAKTADWYRNAISELMPTNPAMRENLSTQVGSALGNLVSLALTSGASAPAKVALQGGKATLGALGVAKTFGKELATPVSAVGGLQMGVSAYKDAKAHGASDDTAFNSFLKQGLTGAVLEQLPIKLFYKRLDTVSGGGVKQLLKKGFSGGTEEMATEVMQQVYGNLDAAQTYDKTRKILDGVGESGGIGFGLGFLLNAMGVSLKKKREQATTPEQIASVEQAQQLLDAKITSAHPQFESSNRNENTDISTPDTGLAPRTDSPLSGDRTEGDATSPTVDTAPATATAVSPGQTIPGDGSTDAVGTPGISSDTTAQQEAVTPIPATLSDSVGQIVNYQGIQGELRQNAGGDFEVIDSDGSPVLVEGGLSGKSPQELGFQPARVEQVATEAVVETLNNDTAPLSRQDTSFDAENNTVGLYGKQYGFEGFNFDKSGKEVSFDVKDENGKIKTVRNQEAVLNVLLQKEQYELANSGFTEQAKDAAEQIKQIQSKAKELDVKPETKQKSQPQSVKRVVQVQQTGSVENNPIPQAATPTQAVNEQIQQSAQETAHPNDTKRLSVAEISNRRSDRPSPWEGQPDSDTIGVGATEPARKSAITQESAGLRGENKTSEAGNLDATTGSVGEQREAIHAKRAEIKARILAKSKGQLNNFAEVIADYVELGATYVEEGVVNFKAFAKAIRKDYDEIYGKGASRKNVTEQDLNNVYKQALKATGQSAPGGQAKKSNGKSYPAGAKTNPANVPVDNRSTDRPDRSTDDSKEKRERGVSTQLRTKSNIPAELAAFAEKDPMLYEVLGNKESFAEAGEDLKKRLSSPRETQKLIDNLSSDSTEDLTRRNIQGMMLMRMFNELAEQTADPVLKASYQTTANTLAEFAAKRGTLAGQGTQVFALLDQNSAEGMQVFFQKATQRWEDGEKVDRKTKKKVKNPPAPVVKATSTAKKIVQTAEIATAEAAKVVGKSVEKAHKEKTSPKQRVEEAIKKRLSTNTTKLKNLLPNLFSRNPTTLQSGFINPKVAQEAADTLKEIIKDLIRLGKIQVGADTKSIYATVAKELGMDEQQAESFSSFAEKEKLYEQAADAIAVERLSSRIYRDTKADNPKATNPVDRMVNELYKAANEAYGKKKTKKAPPVKALDLIKEVFANKSQYADIYQQAVKATRAKLNEDLKAGTITESQWDDAYAQLERYFHENFKESPSQKTVSKAITSEMKAQGVSISQLVSDHYSDKSKSQSLKEALIQQAGLSEAEADVLGRQIEKSVEEKAKAATANKIKALLKGTKQTKLDPVLLADRVAELSRIGVLTEEGIMDLDGFKEKFGIPVMTPEIAQGIADRAKKMQKLPSGELRDVARDELVRYIASHFPVRKLDVFWAIYYPAVLSGVSTHLKNILANTGNVGSETLATLVRDIIPGKNGQYFGGARELIDYQRVYNQARSEGRRLRESNMRIKRIFQLGVMGTKYHETLSRDAKKLTNRRGTEDLAKGPANTFTERQTKALANRYKYVPRALDAEDALFTTHFKSGELFGLVRDFHINQGLSGQALRQAILDELYPTKKTQAEAELAARQELFGPAGRPPETVKEKSDVAVRTVEVLRKSIDPQLIAKAHAYGQRMTFKGRATGIGGILSQWFAKAADVPVVGVFLKLGLGIDFVNIGFNITNHYINYTPIYGHLRAYNLGWSNIPALQEWMEKRGLEPSGNYERGSREFSQQIARANLTTAMTIIVLAAAMKAFRPDGEPDEEYEKNIFDVTGPPMDFLQANADKRLRPASSMRIGGVWVNYTLIPFLNFAMAIAGSTKDYMRHNQNRDKEGKLLNQDDLQSRYALAMTLGVGAAAKSMAVDATPMRNFFDNYQQQHQAKKIEDFSGLGSYLFQQYGKPALTKAGSSVSQPFLPNALRQVARVMDPTVYSPKTAKGMMLKSLGLIPVASEGLKQEEAVSDPFGRKQRFNPGEDVLPFQHWAKQLGEDPVDKFVYGELAMVPRQASANSQLVVWNYDKEAPEKHTIGEDRALYNRYVQEGGQLAYQRIDGFLKVMEGEKIKSVFKTLPPDEQKKAIASIISKAREETLEKIQAEVITGKVKFNSK